MGQVAAEQAGGALPTIVLAGRRAGEDPLARAGGAEHRALVDIAGEPMLARVLGRLTASARVGPLALSIDTPALARDVPAVAELERGGRLSILTSAASPSASALAAFDALAAGDEGRPVLLTTADHALLDARILDHFLDAALASDGEVCVGLVAEDVVRARFPDTRRTYLGIGSERYSGANLFLIRRPGGRAALEFWRRAESHRKRPWRLVAQFGPGLLIAWALGRLDLESAFERGSRPLGARARPVLLPFGEAAVDVDKPADLELVRRVVAGEA